MKKRIIVSILITIVLAIAILSSVFVAVVNIKEVDRTKELLSLYNKLITYDIQKGNDDFSSYKINGQDIRVSIIDKEGQVLYDSLGNVEDNHGNREEIAEAFNKGESSIVRFSDTVGNDLVYYATRVNNDIVIRTSAQVSDTKLITRRSCKYFILVIVGVVAISIALCEKLLKIIVQPVRELEEVTKKIASGDLNKRAVIYYNDEIGSLAGTFNEMADMLEIKISDSLDKQNKFGLVFQNFNLFPHYKVIKNLTLAPSLKGLDKKIIEEKAMKLLASVGLLDSAHLYPYQLSGGGQQRVAITRALMLDPEILCFDEPTSALDPGLSYEVLKAIKGLKDNMRTMIIVTHELDFARGIADKIIFMSDGKICEVSDPNEFFTNPQTKKARAFLSQGLWGK